MLIQTNVPLAPFTTLGVGGPAQYLIKLTEEDALPEALAFAQAASLPIFILGGGSNLVITDAGFEGVVIYIALRGLEACVEDGLARVTVAAGEQWDAFVEHCVTQGWAGLECLSGIPGLVGGTPVQNVGAYGQEVSETIAAVHAFDRQTGLTVELSNAECRFGYRSSRFNTTERGRFIVLRVTYALRVEGAPTLRYAELQQFFAASAAPPSLAEVRAAVFAIRRRKAMVIDPADPDTRSAGSFFKNPIITAAAYAELEKAARAAGLVKAAENVPCYAAGIDQIKIPAAWLIERAGFAKGYTRGRVGLSSKHALALVNRGGATASEVVALMQEIQARVWERFGVRLRPEPEFVGFESVGL